MLAVHLLAIVFSFNGLLRPSATAVRTRQAVAEQPSLAKLQAVIGLAEREANGQLKIARTLRPVVAIAAGVIAATSGSLDGLLSPPAPAAAVVAQVRRQPAQLPNVELVSLAATEALPAPTEVSPTLAGEETPKLVPAIWPSSLLAGARVESPDALLVAETTQSQSSLALLADAPTAEELQKEAEEAKQETMAADLRRKQRLRAAAAERAADARQRQREMDELAEAVRAETRPLVSTQFASEVRKQKRLAERTMQDKTAVAERQAAIAEAVRLAAAQELEADAKALKQSSLLEDARREVRLQEAEAVREAALKAQRELTKLQKLEDSLTPAGDAVEQMPKRRLITG